jgi:hypothetical protein
MHGLIEFYSASFLSSSSSRSAHTIIIFVILAFFTHRLLRALSLRLASATHVVHIAPLRLVDDLVRRLVRGRNLILIQWDVLRASQAIHLVLT